MAQSAKGNVGAGSKGFVSVFDQEGAGQGGELVAGVGFEPAVRQMPDYEPSLGEISVIE